MKIQARHRQMTIKAEGRFAQGIPMADLSVHFSIANKIILCEVHEPDFLK